MCGGQCSAVHATFVGDSAGHAILVHEEKWTNGEGRCCVDVFGQDGHEVIRAWANLIFDAQLLQRPNHHHRH